MTSTSERLRTGLVGLLLAGVTGAVYAQVADFKFVAFDDDLCITANPVVGQGLSWDGTLRVFARQVCANYAPLSWLSHMLDIELYGLDPTGHHLTNVVLHVLNTLLIFLWLRSLTGAVFRSGFVAALFALHPLHVESVAWVAERRDVLSTTFGVAALWGYTRWARAGGAAAWATAFASLLLGLLSKAMLVSWPLLFLLLDYWPLGRLRLGNGSGGDTRARPTSRLLLEKLPFFLLAVAFSAAAVLSESRGGLITSFEALPLDERLGNAIVSYVTYLKLTVWPTGLAALYPHPSLPGGIEPWSAPTVAGSLLLLLVITLGAWRLRRHGYLLMGWLWYGISLAPVIGLIQVGQAALADRYTYVPLLGVFIAFVWGGHELARQGAGGRPWVMRGVAAAALAILAAATGTSWKQIGYWRDSFTLLGRAADVTRGNFSAHYNLGILYRRRGDFDQARHHYERAVEIHPTMARAHNGLGNLLRDRGLLDEAIEHYWEAALHSLGDLRPLSALAATSRERDGTDEVTIAFLRELVDRQPALVPAWTALGNVLHGNGRLDEAAAAYRQALQLEPDSASIRSRLEETLAERDALR